MPTIRERAADALLHRAVSMGVDRETIVRGLDATRPDTPGYQAARGAVAFAGWVDSAMLWFSVRLRAGVR